MSEKIDDQLEQLYDDDVTKTEQYYGRKFKSAYTIVRPAFVLLSKAKKNKYEGGSKGVKGKLVTKAQLTNKQAVEKLRDVLQKALTELE